MTAHVEEAIERYFEGRTARLAERDALFGHLDRCNTCRARFDELARVHRALAGGDGGEGALPATELALIGASVIGGAARPARARRPLTWLAGVLAPAAAAVAALVVWAPGDTMTAKGGGAAERTPAIEVLCFDGTAEIRAHLTADGTCPAPGYVKLVFASPETVPGIFVAVRTGTEVRMSAQITRPKPRSVLADHAELAAGETLEVVVLATEETVSPERARSLPPVLTVKGMAP